MKYSFLWVGVWIPQKPPEARRLGGPFTSPHMVFGSFWKTRVSSKQNIYYFSSLRLYFSGGASCKGKNMNIIAASSPNKQHQYDVIFWFTSNSLDFEYSEFFLFKSAGKKHSWMDIKKNIAEKNGSQDVSFKWRSFSIMVVYPYWAGSCFNQLAAGWLEGGGPS